MDVLVSRALLKNHTSNGSSKELQATTINALDFIMGSLDAEVRKKRKCIALCELARTFGIPRYKLRFVGRPTFIGATFPWNFGPEAHFRADFYPLNLERIAVACSSDFPLPVLS